MKFYKILEEIPKKNKNFQFPIINPGSIIRIFINVKEGKKERIQKYQGIMIRKSGKGVNITVKVFRNVQGVGVERVFFVNSYQIKNVEVLRFKKFSRAKIYFFRKIKESIISKFITKNIIFLILKKYHI